jgi:hypothetical protein
VNNREKQALRDLLETVAEAFELAGVDGSTAEQRLAGRMVSQAFQALAQGRTNAVRVRVSDVLEGDG